LNNESDRLATVGIVASEELMAGSSILDSGPEIIGKHPRFFEVLEFIRRAAATDSAILITGESGTGKELAALAVHYWSKRRHGPFVTVNCAGMAPQLIASELFGHEKGAFTDARQQTIGKIEAASGGTLFLDEIGDLPLEQQGYMLRFLEEKTIERVGGTRRLPVDTRVVTATNVDLDERIAQGRFRRDLYYRIHVLAVALPPLRYRGDDVVLLANHFLARISREAGVRPLTLSGDAIEAIRRYPWPGNVRELIGVLSQAALMRQADIIDAAALALPSNAGGWPNTTLAAARVTADRDAIEAALVNNGENIRRTAKELGISRLTLYRLIDRHSIALVTRPGRARVEPRPSTGAPRRVSNGGGYGVLAALSTLLATAM
jgi:DNA-binding NtrC family response regulator